MTTPECLSCHRTIKITDLLGSMRGYSKLTDCAVAICPYCNADLEFRVRPDSLELGYTYSGGALHFECLLEVAARGLRQHREGDSVSISFQGIRYSPPAAG